jgi:hypothetical protein
MWRRKQKRHVRRSSEIPYSSACAYQRRSLVVMSASPFEPSMAGVFGFNPRDGSISRTYKNGKDSDKDGQKPPEPARTPEVPKTEAPQNTHPTDNTEKNPDTFLVEWEQNGIYDPMLLELLGVWKALPDHLSETILTLARSI